MVESHRNNICAQLRSNPTSSFFTSRLFIVSPLSGNEKEKNTQKQQLVAMF